MKISRSPLWLFSLALASSQNLAEIEKKISDFTLGNGMHFIVIERSQAPVVSFHLLVNSGTANDPSGQTGMAHMFEHLFYKGTESFGSSSAALEKKALAEIETAYDILEAERRKGSRADPKLVQKYDSLLKVAIQTAGAFVTQGMFPGIIRENGGAGLSAAAGPDTTSFSYSLPSNRLELWFMLQSDWIGKPVYRDFYKERDALLEKRKRLIETDAGGRLHALLLSTAFSAHPYRVSIGWPGDIEALRVTAAEVFHRNNYAPANLTAAIAGDIRLVDARRLAEKYFGPIPSRPGPVLVNTSEPVQDGERRATLEVAAAPEILAAFKRPGQTHADDPALEVIAQVLAGGRTGLLHEELVKTGTAVEVAARASWPGGKYPGLFVVSAIPAVGHDAAENEAGVDAALEMLRRAPVSDVGLQRAKVNLRVAFLRTLDDNPTLCAQSALHHVRFGTWKAMFTRLDAIDRVSAADVQRAARQYLDPKMRTVVSIEPPRVSEAIPPVVTSQKTPDPGRPASVGRPLPSVRVPTLSPGRRRRP